MPSPEFTEAEQSLIAGLREHGSDHPETKTFFDLWARQEEKKADEAGISRANIEVNLKRGRLFLAAGFPKEATPYFEDVRFQAYQEGEGDLLAESERLLNEIDAMPK
jgi:hypothetical protein